MTMVVNSDDVNVLFWRALYSMKKGPTVFMFRCSWHLQHYLFYILLHITPRGCVSLFQCSVRQTHSGSLECCWLAPSVYLWVARRDNDKCFPSFFGGARTAAAGVSTQTMLPAARSVSPTRRHTGCLIGPDCTPLALIKPAQGFFYLEVTSSVKWLVKYIWIYSTVYWPGCCLCQVWLKFMFFKCDSLL